MMNEHVDSIMIKKIITLGPKDNLDSAREIFMNKRIHHLPIVEDGKLVGLITTYDLWKANFSESISGDTLIETVMSRKILKISPDDKVGTAAELFLDNRFHALPVVTEDNTLVGLITTFDVLRYEFKKEYPNPILFKKELDEGISIS